MLEGNVEVGQHKPFRHQFDDIVDMRVRIDIVEPHPDAERAELADEIDEFGPDRALVKEAFRIAQVKPIGAGVLGNDEQLPDPGGDELFGFAQHVAQRASRRDRRAISE